MACMYTRTRTHTLTHTQLKCCGIDNATDWITFNREAVMENGFIPPGNCQCDPDDNDDCVPFRYPGQTSTAYVWEDVSRYNPVQYMQVYDYLSI